MPFSFRLSFVCYALSIALSPTAAAQSALPFLRVGVVHQPPYCIAGEDGHWNGMAVELWRHLAEEAGLRYELVALDGAAEPAGRLAGGELDVLLSATLRHELTDSVEFLQHYHLTTLGVARNKSNGILSVLRGLFSLQFLYIVLSLSALLLLIGTIIYFLERKKNADQFGGDRSLIEGIGSGFWWAGVTMTTIGYGDKAPASLSGRIVAMLWMLLAMAVSASLTAAVISAVGTTDSLDLPSDLKGKTVGVVEDGSGARFLREQGKPFRTFPSAAAGLRALKDKEVDMVVADVTALRYAASNNKSLAADVVPTDRKTVAPAIMVRNRDGLADRLDAHMVRFLVSPTWRRIVKEYGGSEGGK